MVAWTIAASHHCQVLDDFSCPVVVKAPHHIICAQFNISCAGLNDELMSYSVVLQLRRPSLLGVSERSDKGRHPRTVHGQQHHVVTPHEIREEFDTDYVHATPVTRAAATVPNATGERINSGGRRAGRGYDSRAVDEASPRRDNWSNQMSRRLERFTKDGSMTHDTPRNQSAYECLRAELLISGLSDWVSLAEVQQIISHFELADTDREHQDLTLRTIRSLLNDGLMQIGELPGQDGKFPAWEPIDVAMDRLRERFVGHYAEPASWDHSMWLGLTETGRPVARALRDE